MPDGRLCRQQRLLKAQDFTRVFAQPQRCANSTFTILFILNHLDHARLGLAVAKKKVRLASARNRIKRQIRETFRLHPVSCTGIDIVVLAREHAGQASKLQLQQSLNKLWQQVAECVSSR